MRPEVRPEVLEMQGGRWEEEGEVGFLPDIETMQCVWGQVQLPSQLLPSNPESIWWVINTFIIKTNSMESELH